MLPSYAESFIRSEIKIKTHIARTAGVTSVSFTTGQSLTQKPVLQLLSENDVMLPLFL
jgi:hypothetical protein